MFKRKTFVPFVGLVILTMLLVACGPAPTPETIEVEVPVEVEVTRIVEGEPEVVVVTATPEPEEPREGPIIITWWSHWAEEDNKKAVILQVIEDYEAEHPDVDIVITWWQKAEMLPAMRNAFTAGEGFPDLFSFHMEALEFIDAGWLEELSDDVNWDNVTPVGKDFWTRGGGTYAVSLEASSDHIYYNVRLFEELGIEVPDDFQFTADEFYEVCKTCRDAGYAPFAQGIGDRTYPGQYLYKFILLHQLGDEEFIKLWNGETSWDRPETREALEYIQKIMALPAMPDVYTTMTLAESHRYFHTQEKACMFLAGAWYTGRAFVPAEQGGQPTDFRLSFLDYPEMPNGVGNNQGFFGFGGGLGVASMGRHKDVALDIVSFFAQPKYGNLWLSQTAIPTGLAIDAATMPESDWKWYFEEYDKVNSDVDWRAIKTSECGDLIDAYTAVFNEGLPQNLLSVDEAIQTLEEARAKCQ
jgi:ABC-type glycerol-3-phosphate transport system substrate-binding protein